MKELRNIWRWREAIYRLVARNLKIRYKNSALGFFWSFLNPLMQIIVMTIAFRYIIGVDIPNYSVQLFTVFLPWMFFQQAISDGSVCVAENTALMKKFAFPRVVLPTAVIASNFIHFALGCTVLVAIFLVLRVAVLPSFLFVPVFLAIEVIFLMGLMLIFSVLRMYYDDIRFILEALLRLWFYLTPLAYNIQMVMGAEQLELWQKKAYLVLNPLTPLMVGFRTSLLEAGKWPELVQFIDGVPWTGSFWFYVGISATISMILLLLGAKVWRKYNWQLPELL